MRLANDSVLAGLVLLFLFGHFILLVGVLIRLVALGWLQIAPRSKPPVKLYSGITGPSVRSTASTKKKEVAYEAN